MPLHLSEAWAAFWRLSADRPVYIVTIPLPDGSSVTEARHGAIPFLAIDAYCRRFGIEGEAFHDFYALVSAMDQAWLEAAAELRAERR